jgi:glycosyltransferase involved in cell wall biosynthesis
MVNPERNVEREVLEGYQVMRLKVPENLSADALSQFADRYPQMGRLLSEIEPRLFVDRLDQAVALRVVRFFPGGLKWARQFFGRWKGGLEQAGRASSTEGKEATGTATGAEIFREILGIRSILLLNQVLHEAAISLHPDLYHCNGLDTLVAGCLGKMEGQLPLVYDAHEIYAEQLPKEARSEIWYIFYSALEAKLVRFADRRMTVCDSLGRWFEETYGSGPFVTVMNCPSRKLLPAHSLLGQEIEYPVKLLYQGAYFLHRGLEQIVDASARLSDARIIFRGFGPIEEALRQRVAAKGLEDRVVFSPPVPMLELILQATEADIGLNPFIPVCLNTEFCLPNKLFEYMMAGLAVASSDLVELRRVTEQYGIGQLFDPKDPEEVATVLNSMISDRKRLREYQQASLKAAREVFHWEREQEKFLREIYNW